MYLIIMFLVAYVYKKVKEILLWEYIGQSYSNIYIMDVVFLSRFNVFLETIWYSKCQRSDTK